MRTFYLGISAPHWLGETSPLPEGIAVCLSRVRLAGRATLPIATRPWLLDSGGFSVLSKARVGGYARWELSPQQYVREVRRYRKEMGMLVAAAPMDWMCEPFMVARTGLNLTEHLRRTVHSLLELRWLAPDLPIFPVLQGDASAGPDDHLRCADMFEAAGIDLAAEPLVGVGSVCRLQSTPQIVDLFAALHHRFGGAARLHGFGVKILGLAATAPALHSADSQAWSRWGRAEGPCRHGLPHVSEANCPTYATEYYRRVLAAAARTTPASWQARAQAHTAGQQDALFAPPAPAAPALPTTGQALALAARAFLPEGAESQLAAALDTFRADRAAADPAALC